MSRDDDPMNDLDDYERDDNLRPMSWVRWLVIILLIVAIVLLGMFVMASVSKPKAQDRGYLPPPRYTQPYERSEGQQTPDPLEYYAEDWVVLDQEKRTVCRDPYVMRDIKIIKCVGRDPVR